MLWGPSYNQVGAAVHLPTRLTLLHYHQKKEWLCAKARQAPDATSPFLETANIPAIITCPLKGHSSQNHHLLCPQSVRSTNVTFSTAGMRVMPGLDSVPDPGLPFSHPVFPDPPNFFTANHPDNIPDPPDLCPPNSNHADTIPLIQGSL